MSLRSIGQLGVLIVMLGVCGSAPARGLAGDDARPLGPAGAPRVEPVPNENGGHVAGPSLARSAASLGVVLTLIFGCAWVFRRYAAKRQGLAGAIGAAGRSPAGILEIVGRYPVGRGSTLVLLRLDRRILLLSQTSGACGRGFLRAGMMSMTPLCEVTDADEVASILAKAREAEGDSLTARFQSLLTGFAGEPERADDEAETAAPGGEGGASEDGVRPEVVVRHAAWPAAVGGEGGRA